MELAAIEKGGYDHFMLKEIFEQPATIYDCLRGRLDAEKGTITMRGIQDNIEATYECAALYYYCLRNKLACGFGC